MVVTSAISELIFAGGIMRMFGWFRRAPTEQQLRVTQALAGYPPYTPPEWKPDPNPEANLDPDPEAMRAASALYREYFLGGMPVRLEALRTFLANFDVALSSDDAGLMAVSTWLPTWGDLLVDNLADEAVWNAYRSFEVPWTGTLIGLNVIFDFGIYYAECLWARRTKLEWLVVRGPEWATHVIQGLPTGKLFDPFNFMYWECRNIRAAKIAKRKLWPNSSNPDFLKTDCFSRHVLANTPPGRRSRKSAR